jgi:hypothetical protein
MSTMFSDHVGQIASFAPLAYLDGGSGSLIFQMLIAGSVTAAYAIKTQWTNLVGAVSRLRNRGSKPADR